MTAYNHDTAMRGHAKARTTCTVTDNATGNVIATGALTAWRPTNPKGRDQYTARVGHRSYNLNRYTVEITQ